MLTYLSITIGGLVVSCLIGYALSDKQSLKISIRDSIIGGILGTIVLTLTLFQFELSFLKELRENLESNNSLSLLDRDLDSLSKDEPLYLSIVFHRDQVIEEIENIRNGRIKLDNEQEVINEWKRLFDSSSNSIYATNFVSPKFWTQGSVFSAEQSKIQQEAIDRGVNIRRLFIYSGESDSEILHLKEIVDQQKEIGIEVKFIKFENLKALAAYSSYSPSLGGAIDFVIYDLNSVLLTYLNSFQLINSGILTKERVPVDNSLSLFSSLWLIASEEIKSD